MGEKSPTEKRKRAAALLVAVLWLLVWPEAGLSPVGWFQLVGKDDLTACAQGQGHAAVA